MRPGDWEHLERPAVDAVTVDGVEVRAGSRVRLHPGRSADVFDIVLEGRIAIVEAIEEDVDDGGVRMAVVVEDDPGRDLGMHRQLGHRFFFSPSEVTPLADRECRASDAPNAIGASRLHRILIAGIGNVFLGDDGFGVALADRLSRRALPAEVEVVDYGIRGMDLAFAMGDGWDAVVLLDATPRGEPPGTLYLIEADVEGPETDVAVDAHGMDPVSVLGLVRSFGGTPPRTLVVGCEPLTRCRPDDEELVAGLSEPVRAALDPAVGLVDSLLEDLLSFNSETQEVPHHE